MGTICLGHEPTINKRSAVSSMIKRLEIGGSETIIPLNEMLWGLRCLFECLSNSLLVQVVWFECLSNSKTAYLVSCTNQISPAQSRIFSHFTISSLFSCKQEVVLRRPCWDWVKCKGAICTRSAKKINRLVALVWTLVWLGRCVAEGGMVIRGVR